MDSIFNKPLDEEVKDLNGNISRFVTWTPSIPRATITNLTNNRVMSSGNVAVARCYFDVTQSEAGNAYLDVTSFPKFGYGSIWPGMGIWEDTTSEVSGILTCATNGNYWFHRADGSRTSFANFIGHNIMIAITYSLN